MFHVGQEVICINPRWGDATTGSEFQRHWCPNLPVLNCLYRVRTIDMGKDMAYIRLVEIVNPIVRDIEPWFMATRFRAIEKLKRTTDISVFEDIRRRVSEREPV